MAERGFVQFVSSARKFLAGSSTKYGRGELTAPIPEAIPAQPAAVEAPLAVDRVEVAGHRDNTSISSASMLDVGVAVDEQSVVRLPVLPHLDAGNHGSHDFLNGTILLGSELALDLRIPHVLCESKGVHLVFGACDRAGQNALHDAVKVTARPDLYAELAGEELVFVRDHFGDCDSFFRSELFERAGVHLIPGQTYFSHCACFRFV